MILFKKEAIRNSCTEKITNIKNSMELFNIRWNTAKERLDKLDYKPETLKDGKWVRGLWECQIPVTGVPEREHVAETILKEMIAENFL